MTPKEKAEELVFQFKIEIHNHVPSLQSRIFESCVLKSAKQCALITVDEIIKTNPYEWDGEDMNSTIDYWEEVKQEIEKL